MTLIYILIATFLISIISFIGALTLFLKEQLLNKILLILVSLSAGALIGSAFLHLLPEAIESGKNVLSIFLFVIFGFSIFFILEQFINWHHHHNCVDCERVAPFSYLILISDAVHNFIDGFIIAASFIIAPPIGIVTTIAVAIHEIPQEIGDFGVLVYSGMKKTKALFLNFLSAFTIVFGGIAGFLLSEKIGDAIVYLLPFAAGSFIYIASSDLIPEIKHKESPRKALTYFVVFLIGIFLMLSLKLL